jgi:hypothetical protein
MRDDVGDRGELRLGRVVRVDQQQALAVGDAPQVLHRALREVREPDHVHLRVGVRDRVVVGEEPQAERPDLGRERAEGALPRPVHDPERHAVDVDWPRGLERTDHERDQVRGHHHRVGEPHPDAAVARRLAADLGAVRDREHVVLHHERDAEHGFEIGLVPAREGPARVGGFELRGRDRARDARVVRVGRAVEPLQLVGELPAELQMQRPVPRLGRPRQEQVRAFTLRVQADRRDLERPTGALEPPGSEVQVDRVQHDLVDRFHDFQHHGLGAGEHRHPQTGVEEQIVATGGDAAG